MKEASFSIQGMACPGCAGIVESRLREIPGVAEARVDFAATRAYVRYDPARVNRADLGRAVLAAGYRVLES
ncbi:MAG: heavy-metal-associated domain-containing protein [bacterium]|nr:heavy-metal-associated domain-containing protein [bacterium]